MLAYWLARGRKMPGLGLAASAIQACVSNAFMNWEDYSRRAMVRDREIPVERQVKITSGDTTYMIVSPFFQSVLATALLTFVSGRATSVLAATALAEPIQ